MRVIWCSAFLLGVAVFAPLESLVLCVDYYNASFPVSACHSRKNYCCCSNLLLRPRRWQTLHSKEQECSGYADASNCYNCSGANYCLLLLLPLLLAVSASLHQPTSLQH